jgi:DNA-binding beta-propeller fold protein YncE
MPRGRRMTSFAMSVIALTGVAGGLSAAKLPDVTTPTNDAPNPYKTIEHWAKLPDGRKMGSTSAVDIDKDGTSVWVAERCGANSCLDRATGEIKKMDVVFKFDTDGNVLKSFGSGMFIAPHGIYVDKEDNIWITDYQDNAPLPPGGRGRGAGRGTPPVGPIGPAAGSTKGHQVFKFSSDGKLLLTIGKAGGAAEPECCYAPNDVIVAKNGDIFVTEGHGAGNNVIFKFDKTGKPIKHWGKLGTGPGEFDQPHSLAFDSKGRLYVADRNNNRVQVFDQDGNYISEMHQFSRPSGIFIDKHDNLYSADSESESVSRNHTGWKRGIRMGSLKDGKVVAFIPDPAEKATGTSAAEGVAVDAKGNIYGAEVGPQDVKKYVKK